MLFKNKDHVHMRLWTRLYSIAFREYALLEKKGSFAVPQVEPLKVL